MRFLRPRNEKSRADWIAQRDIIKIGARNHLSRNDMLARTPFVDSATEGLSIALSGTAIAGGVLESEMVTGGETLIVTVTGDTWHPDLGADNAITTAFLAGITGDGDYATIAALTDFEDVARTSDTVVTLTWPAGVGYAIAADETITVDIPGSALAKGVAPNEVDTFTITNEA